MKEERFKQQMSEIRLEQLIIMNSSSYWIYYELY